MMLESRQQRLPDLRVLLGFVRTELQSSVQRLNANPWESNLVQIHFYLVISKISDSYGLYS